MAGARSDADASVEAGSQGGQYDLFLSHATPDKPWVLTLEQRLKGLGLRVFVDVLEIDPGDNWVIRLSDALERSRYLVLVLSNHTAGRPWVIQEWTSWMAGHGPLGRLLPVTIDAVNLPFILRATQAIDATHRDAQQAADTLFKVVGDLKTLPADDAQRLVLGRGLVFTLSRDDERLTVVTPSGESRQAPLPWRKDKRFGIAHLAFSKRHREPVTEAAARTELFRHARTLGSFLFDALFDEADAARLDQLISPDSPRPVVQVRSDDALLLSLPWELLHNDDTFLVREGRIDLVRTTPTEVAGTTVLKEPKTPFKLVVNVSAPEGSHLSYEAESYRITLATAEHCSMAATELGTLADLVETVDREAPTGVHFSGHGKPGALLFESDEGLDHLVPVHEVLDALRRRLPDDRRLPPFFYLATCHGNEPAGLEQHKPGSSSAAVQLHLAGVTEVVGYFGPIDDELSTRAEEALYQAIAEGLPTRDAVRRARARLAQPYHAPDGRHRPSRSAVAEAIAAPEIAADTHPFAWAQLVLYRRGPEWPLSVSTPGGKRRRSAAVLRRTFAGFGDRRVLTAGFIGRRVEQHRIRRRLREGAKVLVFQGLGGLGKSTLAQQVLPWLTDHSANICTLWCQDIEGEPNRAEALVGQLLAWCRARFGDWEGVVQQVDKAAGDDPAKRFVYFLQVLVQNVPGLVLYLDNVESLLVGPKDDTEAAAFGEWAEAALETIWRAAEEMARASEASYLVASCRYRNDAFGDALLPVTPLPPDALFRLTEWFPALQRLTTRSRARLIARLDGHPRAVEYANDLVGDALTKWRNTKGEWSLPERPSSEDIEREWKELVAPALPKVAEKLKDNLLLRAIWDQVLDERAQRFLYRMTVLRRPADWSLLGLLGEEDDPKATAFATAERLRDTSLLEQVELFARVSAEPIGTVTRYTLHPATVQFIGEAHPDAPALRLGAHRRLGEHLETAAKDSPYVETYIEAGHHLFEAGEFNRAYELLGGASDLLQSRGRVREGLRVLSPFLDDSVQACMAPRLLGRLLGTVGAAHLRLDEVEEAIGFYEQALVIMREVGDRQGEGNVLGQLGLAYANLGEVEKAIGYHERALVIAREIGYRQLEGTVLLNLGLTYAHLGGIEKAIGYYEQQLVIAREIGDRRGEGNALAALGKEYDRLGEVEKAIAYHDQALVIAREIGYRQLEGNALGNLGIAYADLGEVETAIRYHEQALVIAREIGDRRLEGSALGDLGIAYANLGDLEKAIGYHEQALVIAREIGDRHGEGRALGNLGLTYAHLGELEKAIGYYEQQLVIARQIGDRQGEGNALSNLGFTYALLGEVEKATTLLQQAKATGELIGDPRIVQFTTEALESLSRK